jgi:hypothetical protein
MRIFFACLALSLFVGGCYLSHGLEFEPTPAPMGDAGAVPTDDAGLPVIEPDGGPVVMADAGPVVETALRIVFDGPADSAYLRGSQDVVMYHFTLTAYEDVEIRRVPYALEGLTAADRIIGSLGTEYFRDHKIKDVDTGATVMGPISIGDGPFPGAFDDAFVVHAGETRHLIITMDVANTEDVFAELFGDGNNRYRVTVGDEAGRFFPLDGVRRVADGSFVEPEAIENNVRIPGNEMTMVDAELLVSYAAVPCLPRAVSNQLLVPTMGIVFTASAASDVLIRTVRLTGSSVSLPLHDVVTFCALFQGDTQVGLSATPDDFGVMRVGSVNFMVPSGSSVTLEVRCTMDSVVDGDFDTWSIGIAYPSDIDAVREDGFAAFSSLDYRLQAAAEGTDGCTGHVFPHGEVTVETNNLRQSTILVAGPDVWQNFAQYRVTVRDEGADMDTVRIHSTGEAASFSMVAVASDGVVLGTCILPAGTDRDCDVHLSSPLRVERNSSRVFQLWGKLSYVVSLASVGGATTGVARSGNRLRLGLAADVESGVWDASYAGRLNLRFRGMLSGDRMTAAGPELVGNEFVIRRTKPTITRQTLSTTTIANGTDQDLYRFQVSADAAGPIEIARIGMIMEINSEAGRVCNLRLRRGGIEMNPADYSISGPMFWGTERCWSAGRLPVIIRSNQTVSGSGNSYTVFGTSEGFVAGDTISVTFSRLADDSILTGYLRSFWASTSTDIGLDLSPYGAPDSTRDARTASLIWSDLSEVPHSAMFGRDGGSRDWTNGYLIEDLTQVQTLTR